MYLNKICYLGTVFLNRINESLNLFFRQNDFKLEPGDELQARMKIFKEQEMLQK
jgi:hypothetical protein